MVRKLKSLLVALSIAFGGFILGACADTAYAEQKGQLKIWKENRNGQMEVWCVVDDKTGVNYVVVAPVFSEKGYRYDGVCITPRLKADGSLYTSD